MSWRQAGRRDLAALLEFLLPEEALFVPFTSRLRSGARGYEVYMDTDDTGAVRDCFLHTSGGLLLPAFAPAGQDPRELSELLAGLRPVVHSIMGVGRCVDVIEASLPLPPTTRVEYFLMTLEAGTRHPVLPPDPPGLSMRKADVYDADLLFPMQKCYELEEVVIAPAHFNEAQSMKSLKIALQEQLVYVAEIRGVPVSKAGGMPLRQEAQPCSHRALREAGLRARDRLRDLILRALTPKARRRPTRPLLPPDPTRAFRAVRRRTRRASRSRGFAALPRAFRCCGC